MMKRCMHLLLPLLFLQFIMLGFSSCTYAATNKDTCVDKTILLSCKTNESSRAIWEFDNTYVTKVGESITDMSKWNMGCTLFGSFKISAPGNYTIKCAAYKNTGGYIRTDTYNIVVHEHEWSNEYTIDKEASCLEEGSESIHCVLCKIHDPSTERVIPKTDHVVVIDSARQATCIEVGLTEGSHCSTCGTVIVKQEETGFADHVWETTLAEDIPSTCTSNGTQSIHCSICGAIQEGSETDIPLLPHKYSSLITRPATEDEDGVRTYVCTVCGNKYEEDIPKGTALESCKTKATLLQEAKDEYDTLVAHSKDEHDNTVSNARIKIQELKRQGYYTGTNAQYNSELKALNKQITDLEAKIQSASSAALKAKYQAQLDEVQAELDDLLARHSNTIQINGLEDLIEAVDEALENALIAYKSSYDNKVAEIEMLRDDGHTEMIDEAVEATCDHPGKSEGSHCSVCGTILIKQETYPQLEHSWDQGVVTEEATCSQTGILTFTCDKCKQTYTQEIPKLKHIPSDNSTIDQEATCIDAGSKSIHCSLCGETIEGTEESIPALGHDFGDWIVTTEPSCAEAGTQERTCSRCGEIEKEEIPVSHSWDDGVIESEPTCAENGIKTYTCTLCNESKTEEIPATGQHTWDAGVVTKNPTTTAAGIKTFSCTVCGETRTETIAQLPPAAPPTPAAPAPDPILGNLTTLAGAAQALSENGDPAGSAFSILQLKAKKVKNTSITIGWKAVPGATGYVIYAAPCGTKYVKLAELGSTSFTQGGLKKGTYYKYFVAAHNGHGNILASSKTIHVATSGGKKGNTKAVKLNKKKAPLKKGKSVKLKATLKNGKLKVSKHRKVAFESDNPSVATVSKSGKVKAVGPGTCYVYAYAQNGVFAKCKITVK